MKPENIYYECHCEDHVLIPKTKKLFMQSFFETEEI